VAIVGLNLPIVLADDESRLFFDNWILNGTASAAFAMATVVALRQGRSGIYGKAQAALAMALALWLTGELLWTYYELGLGIETPFPSLADAAWLAGYAPAAYYLFRIYGFFGRGRPVLALSILAATAAFVVYTSVAVVAASAEPEEDAFSLAVSLVYVVADGVLIVPAIMILTRLRRGALTGMPWFLLSLAILSSAAGDVGFAYYSAAGLEEQDWVWDLLFNADYIAMAATLFWHNRFFVYDKKAARKEWQKENR
jgi:hypothetical protein